MDLLEKTQRRILFVIRKVLGIRPRNSDEELRRLSWLRNLPSAKPGKVKWHERQLFYADAEALYSQLNEVFVQKQYDFASVHKSPNLIDCGAHVGLVSLRWRQLFPDASIIAIEADPAIGDLLRKNLESANVKVIQKAAWTDKQGVFFRSSGSDNGNVDLSARTGTKIPSFDLADIINETVEFLKMDVEGCEYILLRNLADKGKLNKVLRLVVEFHHWDSDENPLPGALSLLAENGFDCRILSSVLFKKQNTPPFSENGWAHSHVVVAAKRKTIKEINTIS